MSHSRRRLVRIVWLLTAVCLIIGELIPGNSPALRGVSYLLAHDKVLHFSGYAVLAFLPALPERLKIALLGAAAAVLLGILLEFAQRLTATRQFEIADMVANTAGVC